MPNLRYLDISHNKIIDLTDFSKSVLPSLLQLDISYNMVEQLPLMKDSVLEVYNYSHNRIRALDKGENYMSQLTHVYGSHN